MLHTLFFLLEDVLKTFIISMLPVIEIRGALPAGIALGLHPLVSYIISAVGNMLPVPFLILLVNHVVKWMESRGLFHWFTEFLEKKARNNSNVSFWGLFLLVAIPLPGTGAWTGAVVASLLGIPLRRSLPAILLGVLAAGCIVLTASYGMLALAALL